MEILTNVLATHALDGSEDNLFQDADDDDDPFEGFKQSEIDQVEEILENIDDNGVNEIELTDSENEECSDHEEVDDSESDYDSPGHSR